MPIANPLTVRLDGLREVADLRGRDLPRTWHAMCSLI